MKRSTFFLIGMYVMMLATIIFVACEKKTKDDAQSGDYSIVGTWKHYSTNDYYGVVFSLKICFNEDLTGIYDYYFSEKGGTEALKYNFTYTYDPTTCLGHMRFLDEPYASDGFNFLVKWNDQNNMELYEIIHGDEYDLIGVFTRQ